jgi:hypothetical protein
MLKCALDAHHRPERERDREMCIISHTTKSESWTALQLIRLSASSLSMPASHPLMQHDMRRLFSVNFNVLFRLLISVCCSSLLCVSYSDNVVDSTLRARILLAERREDRERERVEELRYTALCT